MKKFNTLLLAIICMFGYQTSQAQLCSGVKGPNLLGAKGTFSAPFITVNPNAASCLTDGSSSFNPAGNIGNALTGCSAAVGSIIPCTDYKYTAAKDGMMPEFTYSIVKIMGDESGSNCLHSPIWKAKDHTGDNGYFMAVNGAPDKDASPLFYQIKSIPVCPGTTYEFSAWVINMMPSGSVTDAPNISFVVNGNVINSSGSIPFDGQWHEVGGSFTATTNFVDLQVINATQVAGGNDLGLDDISFRVCKSQIEVNGPDVILEGTEPNPQFTVSDPLAQNTWYKWLISVDGGDTDSFFPITAGEQATFGADNTYTVSPYEYIGPVYPEMMGYRYRLVVSTSQEGLNYPDCIYVNDYKLLVTSGAPMPVQLTSFDGIYADGVSTLNWKTSQEINNDRFELFRSSNGNDFILAGTIKGAGNSGTIKSYSYQDRIAGIAGNYVYYKLKQIDKNGKFTFSSVVKLSLSNTAKASFQLYPNPVVNDFTATFSASKTATATLIIRNTNGQAIYTKTVNVIKGNNSVFVNNASLKTGMYYVTISNDDINYSGKLQKQ